MVAIQRALGRLVTVLFGHEQGKYPDGDSVERYSIRRHLDRLLADGTASADGQQYWLR